MSTGQLRIRLLGPIDVRIDEVPVVVRGRQPIALLARLALTPGDVVSMDALVDDLWPVRPPARPADALHVYVARLRSALGSERVRTVRPGYALEVAADDVD